VNGNRKVPPDEVLLVELPKMTGAEAAARYGVGRRQIDIRCKALGVKLKPERVGKVRFLRAVLEEIEKGRVDYRIESSRGALNRGRCVVEAATVAVHARLGSPKK
jgi:hypothetical protein